MKTLLYVYIISALTICILFPNESYSERGIKRINKTSKYLALVIGNSSYVRSPLKNPINDARDIAKKLKELGFDVVLKENASQKTMEEAIRKFGMLLRQGGVGLFYFAGHGSQVKGRNYLIPVDAEIQSEADVKYEAVDAGLVLGKMEDAGNKLNIVILDACRNNPFARSFRSNNSGLAKMDAPKGSLIAYSTAPGAIAADGENSKNGIYTKYLLKYMNVAGLKIEEVMKNVRIEVMKETSDKQIPWESSSLTGDFYFVESNGSKETKQQNARIKHNAEVTLWQSIKNDTDIEAFTIYLNQYPNGTFTKLAKYKIKKASESTTDQKKYNKSKETQISFDEVKVRHILVKSKQKAAVCIEKLINGKNFSELAKEVSLCPSGKRGGDLGWFGRGEMVPEFEEAAFNLEKGQLSEIIKTVFGYHVIKLDDKK